MYLDLTQSPDSQEDWSHYDTAPSSTVPFDDDEPVVTPEPVGHALASIPQLPRPLLPAPLVPLPGTRISNDGPAHPPPPPAKRGAREHPIDVDQWASNKRDYQIAEVRGTLVQDQASG